MIEIEKYSDNKYIVRKNNEHLFNVYKENNKWKTTKSDTHVYKTRKEAINDSMNKLL